MTRFASVLGRLVREPLALFLALGALVFLVHALARKPDPRTVVIPRELRAELARRLASELGREPTQAERHQALERWKIEEAAHREALALGLGRDDPEVLALVKQRLLAARRVAVPEPTEADLARWLESHREAFEQPERFDFDQVFFDPERGGAESRARELLARLPPGAPAEKLGDPFRFGNSLRSESAARVRSIFGPEFAARLRTLEPQRWELVPSTEGVHLVRLLSHSAAALPRVQDVRDALTAAWKRDRESLSEQRALRSLLDDYDFVD
jgi:hypothetical protein